jgi:PPOX class probable F420-dependent enzyme
MSQHSLPDTDAFRGLWAERHLCTVTTLRPDGSPHVVPMGVVLDTATGTAWAITSRDSRKVRNVRAAGPAGAPVAVCCVDGRRWSTLEGLAQVRDEPALVREAEQRYAERYRVPRANPARVALVIDVTRVLGNLG